MTRGVPNLQAVQIQWQELWARDFGAHLRRMKDPAADEIDTAWPVPARAQHVLGG